MKHLELHIIQSFPVTCLNRDDFNSPKTAIFGGVQRARVSSQSWKRAIREMAAEISPLFQGKRTRLIVEPLKEALIKYGIPAEKAVEEAKKLAEALSTFDKDVEKKQGVLKVKTLFFTTSAELDAIAKAYVENGDAKKAIKARGVGVLKDAADISLFGRMVANDHSLTVEGAAMFSHALSTHAVQNEPEYFSAVDDLQPSDESGAGMTGTIEFNSATYYRFAALNLDMLKDKDHLEALSKEERQSVVRAFIEASLKAIPVARRNSMNGNVLPAYVLAVVREKGHPVQLVNAFEKALTQGRDKGLCQSSVEALKQEFANLKKVWGMQELLVVEIPEVSFADLLDKVVDYVD